MTNRRAYQTTHKWLKFEASFDRPLPDLWFLLGEACSKCDHLAGVPLRNDAAEALHQMFLQKGALASTAIEGNTLSEDEVGELVAGTLKLPPSREYLAQEVQNLLDACNNLLKQVAAGTVPRLTPELIASYNGQVLRGLTLEEGVAPGKVRTHEVGIQGVGYRGAPAADCDYLLDRLCAWIEQMKGSLPHQFAVPILQAILAHVYLAWIHPFGDGNGRTARLVEHHILLSSGLPAPAAHLLSNHYHLTRNEYYRQLDAASKSGGDIVPFVLYAVGGLVDGLRGQIDRVREQQWGVAWENYVHEVLGDEHGPTAERRRHLVLDLSKVLTPIARSALKQISPRVAEAYATKTDMTLTRDLNVLERLGLIELRKSEGWRARREAVLAFLPTARRT